MSIKPLLQPKEVAAILGVSEGTLQVWRSTGRYNLKFVKVGGRALYTEDAVSEFIERRTRNKEDE